MYVRGESEKTRNVNDFIAVIYTYVSFSGIFSFMNSQLSNVIRSLTATPSPQEILYSPMANSELKMHMMMDTVLSKTLGNTEGFIDII